ncbi:sensor histidine kinase [Campylobacter sp. faydin G-24]|uniref:Sensor histidine kinase n=1 Tax=Campylobacter anatolicus TaxID=2829105 RepID=A0ABS5HJA5_9BACT|nr:ATP-binding protein [Campylobacter anatolicus]MBR8464349.1 sensor histidine kinase [Campylobacter anatolicus]
MKSINDNIKIYITIFIASVFVIMLGANAYMSAKNAMIELSNKNKISDSENIINMFSQWIDERLDSLVVASKLIERSGIVQDDESVQSFIRVLSEMSSEFDVVQFLVDGGGIWVNGDRVETKKSYSYISGLIWYVDTSTNLMPTVNFMPKHRMLEQGTLNFCVPNFYNGEFKAVLCGVVKAQSLFDNIKNFNLPSNSYSFIIANDGEILTPMSDEKLKQEIQKEFKEQFLKESITSINIGSNFISLAPIKHLNWYVGAGVDNKKESAQLLDRISKNAIILLLGFIALATFANLAHNFMYARINRRKNEYELLLVHKSRVGEIGELISGINHQIIQPINSLKLIISTLIMLKRENRLTNEKLESMLLNGKKSISLLADTTEIFKNFYNTNENISEFSIRRSVENLLTLMHTELSYANTSVTLNNTKDKNVRQMQNIIQQILIVLIHNAKDALVEKFKDDIKQRHIFLNIKFFNDQCFIDVIENGVGVDKNVKIFSAPKTTKKFGSGLGLYFSKKLANEKIGGDILLINPKNPTIFRLKFKTNLKDVDD